MKIKKIDSLKDNCIQVIIETPKHSTCKYDFDFDLELFYLDKMLPLGMNFPYDFGFIPGTKGEDGDPLDVLLLMDAPLLQGVLVSCRVIGILKAMQTEQDGQKFRNDRFVAVTDLCVQYKNIQDIIDLNTDARNEIEEFFRQYNSVAGKTFQSLGWQGSSEALQMIKSQLV